MKTQQHANLRIRAAAIAILGLFIALAAAAYLSGREVQRASALIAEDAVPGTIVAHDMRMAISRSIGFAMVAAMAETKEAQNASFEIVRQADLAFYQAVKQYGLTIKIEPEADQLLLGRVKDRFEGFVKQRAAYEALIRAGDRAGSAAFLGRELVPAYTSVTEAAQELLTYNHQNSIAYANGIHASVHRLHWTVAVVMVLALLCAGVLIASFSVRRREVVRLRESEEKFSKAFRSNPSGIAITGMETGEYLEVNDSFCRIMGYSSRELIGRTSVELGIWSGMVEREQVFKSLRDGNSLRDLELQIRTRNGLDQTVLVNAELIELGGKLCIVSLIQDITARKRAEAATRASEERYRLLADHTEDVVMLNDTNGNTLYASPSFFRKTGWSTEDLVGTARRIQVHPDDLATIAVARAKNLSGEFTIIEHRTRRRDGSWIWFEASCKPITGSDGKVSHLLVWSHDITERKLAQENILASNERHTRQAAALLELTQAFALRQASAEELKRAVTQIAARTLKVERVGIWHYDRNRQAIVCQDLFEQTTQSHSSGAVLQAENLPAYFCALAEGSVVAAHDASLDPRTAELTETYLRPLGISSMLDVPINVIGNVAGVLCCEQVGPARQWTADEQTFALAVANVVSLLLAEEERKQIAQQLLRAQRMDAIGTLASGIAHDLNNALAPILMASEILKLTCKQADTSLVLDTIYDSARRGAGMVKQILTFARGSEGDRGLVQPKHLVKEMIDLARQTFPKSIQIRSDLAQDTWPLLGNPTQLHQILLNLCVNARDAMPIGGAISLATANIRLDTACTQLSPDAKPGPHVLLTVADTGTGMPPEVRARIFEAFFTTKEPGKGTGLGLSTVLSIVKEHGGFLIVDSEVGKGTTFKVYLPAQDAADQSSNVAVPSPLPMGQGELILVVDDEAAIRNITTQTLEAYGYRVVTATDGAQAVGVCAQHMTDLRLLITDMSMPVMDGRATIHAVRRIQPQLRVMAVSGSTSEDDATLKRNLDVRSFLRKPFSADDLVRTVHEALQ